MRWLLSLTLLVAGASTAGAQEILPAYLGFSFGAIDYEELDPSTGLVLSDAGGTYRLIGGYRFNENFAFEAAWGETSGIKETFDVPALSSTSFTIDAAYDVVTVRTLGMLPLEKMSLLGGIGFYNSERKLSADFDGLDQFVDTERADSGATFVGGVQVDLKSVTIRGEIEWFDADRDVEATDITFSVLFRL